MGFGPAVSTCVENGNLRVDTQYLDMQQLPILIILLVASPSLLARRCFQCDGIRPGGGLCEEGGLGNIGRQVQCGEWSCGLLREERQILSSTNALLTSTYRWRRDCTRDAKTLVSNSGVEEEDLDYRDTGEAGCQYLQEFVYDNNDKRTSTKTKFTIYFCNTPLCNTIPRHMGGSAHQLQSQLIVSFLAFVFWVVFS